LGKKKWRTKHSVKLSRFKKPYLPRRHEQGVVPRRDEPHRAEGLEAEAARELLEGQVDGRVLAAVQVLGQGGVVLEHACDRENKDYNNDADEKNKKRKRKKKER
jgi:hypothetical protein